MKINNSMKIMLVTLLASLFASTYADENNYDTLQIDEVQYCENYLGLVRKDWKTLPYQCVVLKDGSEYLGKKAVTFLPADDDKKKKSFIRKNVKYVKYNDVLYLNCFGVLCEGRKLGKGFVPLNTFGKDEYFVVMDDIRSGSAPIVAAAMIGGVLIGGVIAGAQHINDFDSLYDKRCCYVYNALTDEFTLINAKTIPMYIKDEAFMEELKDISKKYRYSPPVVAAFFMKLGLIQSAPYGVTIPEDMTVYK